ncbi:PKD domain-containing protein [Plebeiibacterium sediminum]|uniref:PKD domain-containing protein n=1 Tax=Plebeiibacterium sediminum TaxID=2992112 RepID=A0AAE3M5N2_9BACT|nr:PKD domain-containing protein [Plebeiobacterium sediminum]MCW3787401.1 PKD domain-containing protein [Plebeiobacterium sediminum]
MKNQHNTTKHLVALLILTFSYLHGMYAQDCAYLSKANDIFPDGKCAPVTVQWEVTYRGVGYSGTGKIEIQYDWDDGNPVEVIEATLNDAGLKEYIATHSHVYPTTGDVCNYHPRATLVVNGTVCTSSVQEQIVTVWDTDDRNGGELAIDPKVYPICVGNGATFNFTDNSQWNCTPPDENDVVNNEDRWIQWIYGTGGTTITDAQVGGVVRAYPFTGSIDYIPGPVEGPIAPYNTSLDITIPDYYPVGSFFEVTLRNWNVCNPYDADLSDGLPPSDVLNGDYPPVTTTAMALIVALPDATIQNVPAVCVSDDPFYLIAADAGGQWSGPGIANTTSSLFDPKLAGPGTHTITYSIIDANGCSDIGTVDITVLGGPTANILQGDQVSLCPGVNIALDGNPSGGLSPYSHLWKGDIVYLDDTSIQTPDFSTTSVGAYELVYKVTDDNGCFDEDTLDINVEAVNISFANPTIVVCQGEIITLNPAPSGGSEAFVFHQWTGIRIDKLSDTSIQNPVFTTDETGTFTFTYTVRDSQNCEDSDDITVIVNEKPIANAGLDIEICGLQTALNATASVGSGMWKVVSGSGLLSFTGFDIPDPSITSDSYGDYTLRWIEDNNSCMDSADIQVRFIETPMPTVMADKDTCGLSMKLIAEAHVGTSIWKKTEGPGNATFSQELNDTTMVQVDIPGVYKFAYVEDNGGGCIGSDTVEINFYQIPEAIITPPPAVQCTPFEIQFENNSLNADTYYWDFGNGNISAEEDPIQTFSNNTPNPVSYNIKLITNTLNGCSDTLNTAITIAPAPVSYFEMNNSVGCSPLTTDFINKSQGADNYEWTFGDGSAAETTEHATHTFVNEETFIQSFGVQLVVNNSYGCTDTSKLFTTVYPRQNFNLVATPDSGCSPLSVSFIADPGGFKYEWDMGDGNVNQGVNQNVQLYTNESTGKEEHTVTLYTTSVYGCIDTTEVDVTVLPSPTTYFEPNDFAICSPKQVTFINHTEDIETSYWDFGDGNNLSVTGSQQVDHTYVNNNLFAQNYQIRLVTENAFGCKDSMDGFTTVNPAVTASISGGATACSPYAVQFLNESVGAVSYFWDFDDGNTSNNIIGVHVFENPGDDSMDFNVSMIANSAYGCSDTAYATVTVLPSPDTYFEPNDFSVCSPKLVEFTNYTENITSSQWTFGDGAIETVDGNQSITHTYYNDKFTPLDYRIRLITENAFGCRDSMDGYTSVNPNVQAVITGSGEGCTPLEVSLGNESIGANEFLWNYGDGNTSANYLGLNTFENNSDDDQEYEVSLIATSIYGCVDTAYTNVNVFATPKPSFIVTPEYQQMPASTVDIDNTTPGNQWSYEWHFGDGETSDLSEPGSHTYVNSGAFTITLKAYDGQCSNTTEHEIEIAPNIPAVSYGPSSEGCPALTVEFYSETLDAENFFWEFGDGNVSAEPNPVHTYYTPGEYNVKLTVTGPGGQTIKDDLMVNVFPQPTAFFEAYPKVVTIPGQSVTFANKSVEADSYVWNFGNGDTSTEQNPVYEYSEAGNYDVTLEATNDYGCFDVYELNEPIIAIEGGEIAFPNAFTPNPGGDSSGEYVFGDKNNHVFYPAVQEGIEEYKLQIFSRWGQLIFESHDIKIGWNGYYKGSLCAQGVYIWKVTCRFGTGQVKVYTGDVTLIR